MNKNHKIKQIHTSELSNPSMNLHLIQQLHETCMKPLSQLLSNQTNRHLARIQQQPLLSTIASPLSGQSVPACSDKPSIQIAPPSPRDNHRLTLSIGGTRKTSVAVPTRSKRKGYTKPSKVSHRGRPSLPPKLVGIKPESPVPFSSILKCHNISVMSKHQQSKYVHTRELSNLLPVHEPLQTSPDPAVTQNTLEASIPASVQSDKRTNGHSATIPYPLSGHSIDTENFNCRSLDVQDSHEFSEADMFPPHAIELPVQAVTVSAILKHSYGSKVSKTSPETPMSISTSQPRLPVGQMQSHTINVPKSTPGSFHKPSESFHQTLSPATQETGKTDNRVCHTEQNSNR